MDLRLFGRVLWRFKYIVVVGLIAATALAALSFVRVSFSHGFQVTYRKHETWVSYTRLLVGQQGFQLGSTFSTANQATLDVQQATQGRFATLAVIYSNLVTSDPVQRIMLKQGPIHGTLEAAAIEATPNSGDYLPIMSIAAFAHSPEASRSLAARASDAIRTYIKNEQSANGISSSERVQLKPINAAGSTKIFTPRKKTLPIVIFLTMMLAVVGLAFILENLMPRPRLRAETQPTSEQLRTAS